MTDVLMPRLSDTMAEGVVSQWLKKEGDPVRKGDVLAEIETDKATMELEAYDEGIIERLLVPEGAASPSPSSGTALTPPQVRCHHLPTCRRIPRRRLRGLRLGRSQVRRRTCPRSCGHLRSPVRPPAATALTSLASRAPGRAAGSFAPM